MSDRQVPFKKTIRVETVREFHVNGVLVTAEARVIDGRLTRLEIQKWHKGVGKFFESPTGDPLVLTGTQAETVAQLLATVALEIME